jgi:hypothetical protein
LLARPQRMKALKANRMKLSGVTEASPRET